MFAKFWKSADERSLVITISKELTEVPAETVSFKNLPHLGSNDVRNVTVIVRTFPLPSISSLPRALFPKLFHSSKLET